MGDPAQDALVRQMRDAIMDNDQKIVAGINTRLKLVERLRAYKAEVGLEFVDPQRERWMRDYLVAANPGPLSDDGLDEIYTLLLSLTKRETAGD